MASTGPADANGSQNIMVSTHCPPAMRKRDVWRVDSFHLLRKIGSGYASTVYLASCKLTGNQVAVKLYHKSKLSELNLFQVAREIRIHCKLDHKHIVALWAAFEDNFGIYLVSEFASKGDVFTEVERRGGQMTEAETVRQVVYPFLLALDYLHANNIIHRDIKPENLLFTATGVLKVGDFGLSINITEERPVTRVGTLDYMAPEVVVCPDKHKPSDHKDMVHLYYTNLVDSWAVGVLAYELIIGKPPFDKGNKKATIQEILNAAPLLPNWLSEGAVHFIRWALTKEQAKRPTIIALLEHPWIVSHLKGLPNAAKRLLQKADSYAEAGIGGGGGGLGMPGFRAGSFSSGPSPAAALVAFQEAPTFSAATGQRVLGHSNSLSAMDSRRFRDVHLDSITGEMAAATAELVLRTKRVSDSQTANQGRPSMGAHILGGIASTSARNSGSGSARASGAGGALAGVSGLGLPMMGRVGSFSSGAQVALAVAHAQDAAAAAMAGGAVPGTPTYSASTREELIAALQRPTSFSIVGSSSMNRSFTAGSRPGSPYGVSPYASPAPSPLGNAPPGPSNTAQPGLTHGSPGMRSPSGSAGGFPVMKSQSFYMPSSSSPGRPSPLNRAGPAAGSAEPGNGMSGMGVMGSSYAPGGVTPESVSAELAKLNLAQYADHAGGAGLGSMPMSPGGNVGTASSSGMGGGGGSVTNGGGSNAARSGGSGLRPQPPATPSTRKGGVSPLVPSRLSHSFTSPMSPLAAERLALQQAHAHGGLSSGASTSSSAFASPGVGLGLNSNTTGLGGGPYPGSGQHPPHRLSTVLSQSPATSPTSHVAQSPTLFSPSGLHVSASGMARVGAGHSGPLALQVQVPSPHGSSAPSTGSLPSGVAPGALLMGLESALGGGGGRSDAGSPRSAKEGLVGSIKRVFS